MAEYHGVPAVIGATEKVYYMFVAAPRRRKHFGTIRQLPSGRYQARYTDHAGTQQAAPHTFRERKQAEIWLSRKHVEIEDAVTHPTKLVDETVAVWAERWMASKLNLKPNTKTDYDKRLRVYVLPRWGERSISKITRGDVQQWVQDIASAGRSASTIRHAVGTLSRVLNEAIIAGALAANPCQRISMPRAAKSDIKPLTIAQVKALAYEIEYPPVKLAGNGAYPPGRHHFPEYGLLVRLASFSGLRAAEIAGLKVNAVDLDNGALRVTETLSEVSGKLYTVPPKTYQARAVPLPNFLVEELRTHIAQLSGDGDGYVFRASEGGPLGWQNFYNKHFKPAVIRAGLPETTRFHDLRHTAAALMIAANAHPRAIMERLGHSSVTVTLGTYGHLLPSLDEELTRKLDAQWTKVDDI